MTYSFVVRMAVLLVAGSSLVACGEDGMAGAKVIVELGDVRLAIPEANLAAAQDSSLTRSSPRLKKDAREINILFSASDLQPVVRLITTSDIIGTLKALDADALLRAKNADRAMVDDLWLRRGRFRTYTEVAPIPGTPLVQILDSHPAVVEFWEVVRMGASSATLPDNVFDFWVASCNATPSDSSEGTRDGTCLTHIYVGRLRFRFWIAESMLGAIDPLRQYLSTQIAKWSLSQQAPNDAG